MTNEEFQAFQARMFPPTGEAEVLEHFKAAGEMLPEHFGEGWMSRPARDMMRIACLAGFDPREIVKRLSHKRCLIQERHVLSVMDVLSKELHGSSGDQVNME